MTDMDQRVERLESVSDKIVVILEGEPVLDIDGAKIDTTGGVVKELERHGEALHVIDHKLDGVLAQLPRCWTTTQRISALMVVVVLFVGSLPVWAL